MTARASGAPRPPHWSRSECVCDACGRIFTNEAFDIHWRGAGDTGPCSVDQHKRDGTPALESTVKGEGRTLREVWRSSRPDRPTKPVDRLRATCAATGQAPPTGAPVPGTREGS